ncbi:MAG TPA: hypothetical protein VFO03_11685 [Gaiellaceae bacterium]|nr:hypothetical protein [Gaiellaceae bacterium]
MRCLLAAALAVLVLAGAAGATIKPGHGMSGIVLGMTPTQVAAKLGRPIGKSRTRWYYARVWVGFRNRRVVELTTTRSTQRLANGLGVDSTEAEVRAVYPQAQCALAGIFRRCRLGSGAPGSRVTDFIIGHGRVLQVTIQQLP